MPVIKITSKRQATFPKALYYYTIKPSFFRKNFLFAHRSGSSIWLRLPAALCNDLGVTVGSKLSVEKELLNGGLVSVLRPDSSHTKWFGSLRKYVKGKSHNMRDIRSSIGKAIGKKKLR